MAYYTTQQLDESSLELSEDGIVSCGVVETLGNRDVEFRFRLFRVPAVPVHFGCSGSSSGSGKIQRSSSGSGSGSGSQSSSSGSFFWYVFTFSEQDFYMFKCK